MRIYPESPNSDHVEFESLVRLLEMKVQRGEVLTDKEVVALKNALEGEKRLSRMETNILERRIQELKARIKKDGGDRGD